MCPLAAADLRRVAHTRRIRLNRLAPEAHVTKAVVRAVLAFRGRGGRHVPSSWHSGEPRCPAAGSGRTGRRDAPAARSITPAAIGRERVIDGGTIRVGGGRIRLQGLAAPNTMTSVAAVTCSPGTSQRREQADGGSIRNSRKCPGSTPYGSGGPFWSFPDTLLGPRFHMKTNSYLCDRGNSGH